MEIKSYERIRTDSQATQAKAPSLNEQLAVHWKEMFTQSLKEQAQGLSYSIEGCSLNAVRKDGSLYIIGAYQDIPSRSFGNYRVRASAWHSFKDFEAHAAGVHIQANGGMKLFQSWNRAIAENAWDAFNSLADANSKAETDGVVLDVLTAIGNMYAGGKPISDNAVNAAHLQFEDGFFESSQFAGVLYSKPIPALEAFEVVDGRLKDQLTAAGWKATDVEEAQEWVIKEAHLDTSLWNERKRNSDWLRWMEVNGQKCRPYRGTEQRGVRAPRKAVAIQKEAV